MRCVQGLRGLADRRRRLGSCAGALPWRTECCSRFRPQCPVGGLLDALERDVYSAAERCWRLEDKVVTLRGGAAAVVTLRAKAVCLQVRQAALWWKEQ